MFSFFKKSKSRIFSPVSGELIPIEQVQDDVFSQKMMGDGIALNPRNGNILSPIDGIISTVFPTKHAVGITSNDGLELIVHMGLDTVELKGEPFEVSVAVGDKVRAGEDLAKMDLAKIESMGKMTTLVLVITNMDKVSEFKPFKPGTVNARDAIAEIALN